jgi:hypothetical protein
MIVFISMPDASMKRISGAGFAAPSGARPARKLPTAVPSAPGTYEETRNPLRIASTGTAGSLSTMNARPITVTRVVRAWKTWNPLSGSGPSYPGPTSRYFPPSPRSGPGRPMSVTHWNHMSSSVPRIPDGASTDGTSSTIGPSDRSTNPQK